MLSQVLIRLYDLPPMAHIQDDSIVGHIKSPPVYKNIPQIVHSHSYPHALTLNIPFLHYPKYLVLVRDLRESLVSHYERFKGDYGDVNFSAYLRGDVRQKMFYSDIYTRIRFMNEWDRVDGMPDEVIRQAVLSSTREKMAQRQNPEVATTVVRTGGDKPIDAYFTPDDQEFFDKTCEALLAHDFGYGYKICQN